MKHATLIYLNTILLYGNSIFLCISTARTNNIFYRLKTGLLNLISLQSFLVSVITLLFFFFFFCSNLNIVIFYFGILFLTLVILNEVQATAYYVASTLCYDVVYLLLYFYQVKWTQIFNFRFYCFFMLHALVNNTSRD